MRSPVLRALLLAATLLVAAGLARGLKPERSIADELLRIDLRAQVPTAFGGWRVDPAVAPVLPDPTLQARLDSVYDQTLARTYVNPQGERVMLTIAYGRDQSSEATAVHRPEFCYGAQGFGIRHDGESRVVLPGGAAVRVQRLVGTLGQRVEPISYWVTLADQATLPGFGRKWAQLRMGLSGVVADGMLVRVSTLDAGDTPYALQDKFLHDLARSLPPAVRARYFGAPTAPGTGA
jgi:EpsI family protein